MRKLTVLIVGALWATFASGCSRDEPKPTVSIRVLAAASLKEAFDEIGAAFTKETGTKVELSYGGSSGLVTQIQSGAPADVFASADEANMKKVIDSKDVTAAPTPFARNTLTIAVGKGNPKGLTGLADLARRELLVGLCGAEVPCGKAAREAFAKAGATPAVDTNEPDVRALLTKVETGDLDAGVVYVTDVRASAARVASVAISAEHNVINRYPIAPLARAAQPAAAGALVAYVAGPDGQRVLGERGFLPLAQ